MNKIILLSIFLLFIGNMGCTLERSKSPVSSAVPLHERRHGSEKSSAALRRGVSQTRTSAPPKFPSKQHTSSAAKQQNIPTLKKRISKGAVRGDYVTHVVQPGETLSQITMENYGLCGNDLLEKMKEANQIKETDTVQAGWKLILPIMTVEGEIRPTIISENDSDTGRSNPSGRDEASDGDIKSAAQPQAISSDDRNPDNDASAARWQQGIVSFEKKDYRAAYHAFASLLAYGQNQARCRDYLKQIEAGAALHLENGLSCFRKRNYTQAIQEIQKARIPTLESQTTEYLFKSHFEIALKNFLQYKRTGLRSYYAQAIGHLNQAREYRSTCAECVDYEEIFKKTHYNNGIKYFTDNDGEGMDKAVQEWEKVRFIDPDYKEVSENIVQAEALLKKLKKIKKLS